MALKTTVKWENKPGDIIYKFSEGTIASGAKLIVMEHQEAVFFYEGQALDSFGPGKHTLRAGSAPILEKAADTSIDRNHPLPAEVYFLNKSEVPNLKWGTKHPIQLLDPVYNIAVPVRAFGNYSIRIQDSKSLLMMAIGTWGAYTSEAVGTALRDQIIIPKFQDLISETILKQKISILKIAAFLDEIGISGKIKISEDFTSFGIELVRFAIESINVPDDDENVKRLKDALADKAEIGIIGHEDYKMKRIFDTMEKAAESKGGAGLLGLGANKGNVIPGMVQKAISQDEAITKCPNCNAENKADAKFCSNCGRELVLTNVCPQCNTKVQSNVKFCPKCGEDLQNKFCPKCKAIVKPGSKFCAECGRKLK